MHNILRMPVWVVLVVLVLCGGAMAGDNAQTPARLQATPEEMHWWRDAKFGLFIHWGPVSLKGTEIGWSRDGERRGRPGGRPGEIPAAEYDNLYKQFNPTKFDAREWVRIAQAAGMKYLVFTSKHHDGFCEFDSKLTTYTIMHSPFGRDVCREIANACHEAGLKVGWYYSQPDWYHPDYRTENHARYIEYLHGQLRELCTNYGKIDIIWFDGLGGKPEDWDSTRLITMIRTLQPGVIINNRAGLPADHDTPEQRIGKAQFDRAWESCITICRQWAWKPNDEMKSLKQCLQTLVQVVGGDGNLLFNVGPMPTGEIEPRQVERLKEMGAWLKKYGESIYGTRGGPFVPAPWGVSTRKGNKVYVHILDWNYGGGNITLPAIPRKVVRHSVLTGGTAEVKQTRDGIEISVPENDRQDIDTIVVLELDGSAMDLAPVAGEWKSLTTGKTATASNVYQKDFWHYGPQAAVDGDPHTRWATDRGVRQAWLEVDLGAEATFDRARIVEEYNRVRKFELQYKKGDQWIRFAGGDTIGDRKMLSFPPVTAQVVRLNILNATEGPTLCEFHLYAAKP
ncbi:MAG: alpha-L-fucosidase [Candidatus Sumerlaeia bacterium]|nr:alpha-L-fucosidase [Candidatus Sumerlaeia bacterium]